jgi:hypothetical protein
VAAIGLDLHLVGDRARQKSAAQRFGGRMAEESLPAGAEVFEAEVGQAPDLSL